MSSVLTIQSHRGPYSVHFDDSLLEHPDVLIKNQPHFIVDSNVANIYSLQLQKVLSNPNTIVIEATEKNKSIEQIIPIIRKLVNNKIRRNNSLVAIGGGIIQDITCFISSTLLRGLPWTFIPTTLLAQSDSCIGSKSSVNLGDTKNILGTFNPPNKILLCSRFLESLDKKDIHSGIGEIIKVHAIEGVESFDSLSADYEKLFTNSEILMSYTRAALQIKQKYIEEDEFDVGIRNIFNFGHSFGHAIESATNFSIPHGVAITIGMDMANYVACERGLLSKAHRDRMRRILISNYSDYKKTTVPFEPFIDAIMKDKKNTPTHLVLILAIGEHANIERVSIEQDGLFRSQCKSFWSEFKE